MVIIKKLVNPAECSYSALMRCKDVETTMHMLQQHGKANTLSCLKVVVDTPFCVKANRDKGFLDLNNSRFH